MAVAVQEIKDGIAAGIEIGVPIAGGEIYEKAAVLAKGLGVERVCLAGMDLSLHLLHLGQREGEHQEAEKLFHCGGFWEQDYRMRPEKFFKCDECPEICDKLAGK